MDNTVSCVVEKRVTLRLGGYVSNKMLTEAVGNLYFVLAGILI